MPQGHQNINQNKKKRGTGKKKRFTKYIPQFSCKFPLVSLVPNLSWFNLQWLTASPLTFSDEITKKTCVLNALNVVHPRMINQSIFGFIPGFTMVDHFIYVSFEKKKNMKIPKFCGHASRPPLPAATASVRPRHTAPTPAGFSWAKIHGES